MLGAATQTELTVAQGGLGVEYQAVRSAGWICSLQMGCRCSKGGMLITYCYAAASICPP